MTTAAAASAWAHRPGTTIVHRLSARSKLVAVLLFAVVVVATPREWFLAYALYACAVVAVLIVARARPGEVARRLSIELPFVVFALLLPFVATGPRIEVAGLSLATAGLWGAWAMLAKSTLAVLASIALIVTTEPGRIVVAFGQLGLPRALTSIMTFMVRYLDLIVAEGHRMRVARESRGFQARGPRSWQVLSRSVGSRLARAHARGERVHLAMVARGFDDGA